MISRRLLSVLLASALSFQGTGLAAQAPDDFPGASKWRRWAFAAAGAAFLGGIATLTDQASDEARSGVCETTGCVVGVSSLLGAGLGFLLGYEVDQRADRKAREGPTIDMGLAAVELPEGPSGLVDADDGVVALSRTAVSWVDASMVVRPLVEGLPARAATVTLNGDLLLLATSTQMAAVTIPDAQPEPVILSGTGAAALADLGDRHVAVGEPGRIRRMEVTGSPLAPSLMEGETVATRGLPASLVLGVGGNVLWTLEDSSLVSRNAVSLAETGRLALPGRGVAVSFTGTTAVVALGNQGAVLVDVSDPRSPRLAASMGGMEFAYDGVVLDGRVYVSAGGQGLFVYDLEAGQPVRRGVVRDPDFAGDLLVHDGRLYILDRASDRMYRN